MTIRQIKSIALEDLKDHVKHADRVNISGVGDLVVNIAENGTITFLQDIFPVDPNPEKTLYKLRHAVYIDGKQWGEPTTWQGQLFKDAADVIERLLDMSQKSDSKTTPE